jgi:hypothetical protein
VIDHMRAMRRPGESCSQVILRLVELETSDLKQPVRLSRLRSAASHGDGRAFEGQSRNNKIGVALGLNAEHQYRLFRRSQAECQDTVDIERCEICSGDAKILHQHPKKLRP